MNIYLCVYCGSLVLAMVITPIVIYVARVLRIYDSPDVRKVHASAIPRIGGIAIFLAASILVIAVLFLDNNIGQAFRSRHTQVIALLATSTFIFMVGLVDDLSTLRARYKLLAQIAAAVALWVAGVRIDLLNVAGLFTLNLGWLSLPITVFWIIAITNAVNLTDGLDGLAAGISAVACAVIAIFAFDHGQTLMVVIMLAMLGSLSGFLFFNFNPARIFMGDCGSMFLGFLLASGSVMCAMKSGTIVGLALPALALGLPIFDTIFSMLRRYIQRRGIMSPDRSHFHHTLLDMGLRHRHVVIIMYGMTVLAAGLGMFMMIARDVRGVAIFFCVLLLLVLVFRAVGAIQLRQIVAGLRLKQSISRQMKEETESFEKISLHFQQAKTFDQWWQTVCLAVENMDFLKTSLSLSNRDGTNRVLGWERPSRDTETQDVVEVTFPVRDRRAGSLPKLKVNAYANGSVESASRRIALFARLIEEHSIASLPATT